MTGLQVLEAGPLTTVQDLGRRGLAHLGVPRSGAADRGSLRLANRLVGNAEAEPGLEVTVGGLAVRAGADLTVAVTGAACPVLLDRRPVPRNAVLAVPAGAVLRLGAAVAGARCYLAVRGGLAVPPVLGSCATDTLSGLGPAVLRAGQVLPLAGRPASWPVLDAAPVPDPATGPVTLHAVPGPRGGGSAEPGDAGVAGLVRRDWQVAPDSDRVGVRLQPVDDGPAVPGAGSVPSQALVAGAVQLTPSGLPVLFLADHPVTGGYPVVAVLLDADLDLAGQLVPGQRVRFRAVPGPVF